MTNLNGENMATMDPYHVEKTELALYIENEGSLYPMKKTIIANMKRKIEQDKYDANLAVKGWLYWVNRGAVQYCKEFRVELIRCFPMAVRLAVAKDISEAEYAAIKAGEYGELKMKAKKPAAKTIKKTAKKTSRKRARP
jgi:hypothetical protein